MLCGMVYLYALLPFLLISPVHAADKAAGCGVGSQVLITLPHGLFLPAEGTDPLSRSLGVGAIRFEGSAKGHRLTCIVSNELGRELSLNEEPLPSHIERSRQGGLFFLNSFFQLQCEADGAALADLIGFDQIDLINEAMKGKIEITADACTS